MPRTYDQTRSSVHSRPTAAPEPSPWSHQRRSWTDNGVRYTMESASYSSPGLSFQAMGGGSHGMLGNMMSSSSHTNRNSLDHSGFGNGLFGAALGLMEGLWSSNQPRVQASRALPRQTPIFDDSDEDPVEDNDDDLAYGSLNSSNNRRRSMFSRVKDRFLDGKQQTAMPPQQTAAASRSARPQRETRHPQRGSAQRAAPSEVDAVSDDEVPHGRQRPQNTRSNSSKAEVVAALETAVQYHNNEVKKCKKQLERATRQRGVHSGHLQPLLNELRMRERSLATAIQELESARINFSQSRSNQLPPRNRGPSRTNTASQASRNAFMEDPLIQEGMPGFSTNRRSTNPIFAQMEDDMDAFGHDLFDDIHRHFFGHALMFDDEPDDFGFFGIPRQADAQRKRPRYTRGPSSRSAGFTSGFTSTPPKPPPTLLTPEEAKRLFEQYNKQWLALAPTDSRIPYPTRGLHAPALVARDTLWAPTLSAHPATWSEETVMQANAQAFFLNVVGLTPQYSEAPGSGQVQMGYEKAKATATQKDQLVAILKKEKMRWHSDKLGRRNNGRPGANEALQNDARARAVFHAVCALMETAME
ncbi:hypothetical protein KC332_g11511 [Hortaea werneckii]|uniref:Uncharacterized protein n=1 Tax=Hortaea werneckii TaxID=91943 RepID=A0A3M7JBE7_HORWE|nr:hypothetical protein KC358_g11497 [Hortaea werneckii]KAI6815012.1 hypothetical protein KC350_g11142 [Hortaea werneckii]KAI6916049.1 hypothetical protein KC348_g11745 [Hortaea werneckii]KAI6928963.1 hypothetical protein KC341_g11171 [Hortaea werneckii]KAI6962591.1 hypothetical protein KC321_g11681 [Hortaea werneckii]